MIKENINTNQSSAVRDGQQSRYVWLIMIAMTLIAFLPVNIAWGHGERTHAPSLRMRSIQFYDVTWQGAGEMKVGDKVTMTGKIYFPPELNWPTTLQKPDIGYLQTSGPAAVFAKIESYISEVPMVQSASGLAMGKTYTFKLVMQARIPGKWHIHPSVQMVGNGPIVGPGLWTDVTGSWSDYKLSGTAGQEKDIIIENLGTYALDAVYGWHAVWFVMGIIWMLWWVKRPTLVPRHRAVQEDLGKELLITRADKKMGVLMLCVTLALVIGGAMNANAKYNGIVPLQTGNVPVFPLPEQNSQLVVKGINSVYTIPKRSMSVEINVTNNGDKPVKLGEFATAGIRFVMAPETLGGAAGQALEDSVEVYNQGEGEGFVEEYVREVLEVKDGDTSAILPGESRTLTLVIADAVWEIQGLSMIVESPVRRVGGLVYFFDTDGKRYREYVDMATDVAYR